MMLLLDTSNFIWVEKSKTPLVVHFDMSRKRFPKPKVDWFLDLEIQNLVPELVNKAYTAESLGRLQGIIFPRWYGMDDNETVLLTRTLEKCQQAKQLAPELPWIPTIWGSSSTETRFARELLEAYGLADGPVHFRLQFARNLDQMHDALEPLHSMNLIGSGFAEKHLSHAAPWFQHIYTDLWHEAARHGHHPSCTHKSCQNCLVFAEDWRDAHALAAGENQLSLLS